MSVLAECAFCRRKQAVKNKRCKKCKEDLDKQKWLRKVRFWIDYRLPGGNNGGSLLDFQLKKPGMLMARGEARRERAAFSI